MPPSLEAIPHRSQVGRPLSRREDVPLVRGEGIYTDDIDDGAALRMHIVRSAHGHARITDIDVSEAVKQDGVVAVYTAEDLREDGIPGLAGSKSSLHGVDDPSVPAEATTPLRDPTRPLLADDRVRYSGEPVAAILAENGYLAEDAAEYVDVSYERLDAVTHPEDALEADAPAVHEGVPDNLAFDWEIGDRSATDRAVDDADNTVSVDIAHQRISPTAIEPRAAYADYDRSTGQLTVKMGTQGPHKIKALMENVLGLPEEKIRVVAPEVGGGFGCKSKYYPAEALAAYCSYDAGRPIKWQAVRTESHRSDIHGRGRTISAELGFDDDGTFRGLRVDSVANLGAYVSRAAPGTRTGSFVDSISGQYVIPEIHCRVRGAFTTTTPVDSFRGSSRPMTLLTVERLVRLAASKLGVDPTELRRQNFIPPDAFPYETPVADVYDSGRYERAMDRALEMVDYEELRAEQERLRSEGRYLGIGLNCVMDNSGTGASETARIHVDPSGRVTAHVGTADQGQGHRTAFAQLVSDLLGVPIDDVVIAEGDTGGVPDGGGASGSRSVVTGGEALRATAEAVVDAGREALAEHHAVDPGDVEFSDGAYSVRGGSPRHVPLQDVAGFPEADTDVGDGDDGGDGDEAAGLEAMVERSTKSNFPFGTHVAVVEVDPDTGDVEFRRYVAVDDCGVQVNPKLVKGQVVGGVATGIGQALYENARYDEHGTLLTETMMNYRVPLAKDIPRVETDHTETPSPYNELGVKGAGEGGATAAPAAVANAVADALEPLGVDHVDLPMTPERIWDALESEN